MISTVSLSLSILLSTRWICRSASCDTTFFSSVPLHVKVLNYEIIFVGVIHGGIVGTVVAVMDIVSSVHFVPPCYVNLTAASLANQA